MYSMVVMAALTTGTSAPDCGFFRNMMCGHSSCFGNCAGSCNGCYGNGYSGNYRGCYGGCYGSSYGYGYTSSCYGCHGCFGCAGYTVPFSSPYQVVPNVPMPPAGEPAPPPKETSKETKAKLIIDVPAEAKLFIDDQPIKASSARRAFSTPTLELGQSYYYVVRAEVERDGKTYELTKRIIVRAGEQVNASFKDLEASPAYLAKSDVSR